MNQTDTIEQVLKDALKETGASLSISTKELATYMHARAVHLASIAAEPGYDQALRAERNNVALKAGIIASGQLSSIDSRILGLIQGILALAAAAI
jgi:hypothetical protein